MIIINALLALLLYVLNGIIGRFKASSWMPFDYSSFGFDDTEDDSFAENFLQAIVHPAIYIAIVAAVLQTISLNQIAYDLWLVTPFYWLLRVLNAIIRDLISFINWRLELTIFLVSLLTSEITLFAIVRPLLSKNLTVFIDLGQFRDAFWFAVFTYLAKVIWDHFKARSNRQTIFPGGKKTEVVIRRYNRFKRRYQVHIDAIVSDRCEFTNIKHREHFLCVVYAIMIFEDHNRPWMLRIGEYFLKIIFWNKTRSLGIMQVQTSKMIGNKKSIELAIGKLYSAFATSKVHLKLYNAITDYNPSSDYYDEVISIYEEIKDYNGLGDLGVQRVKVIKRASSCALK